jgi:hypothetical protein
MLSCVRLVLAQTKLVAGVVLLAAFLVAGTHGQAHAQNLITDPNFTNGLNSYTDSAGTILTTVNDTTVADASPGGQLTATISDVTIGTEYVFTFLAAAANTDQSTSFLAILDGTDANSLFQPLTTSAATLFTLTGTATATTLTASVLNTGSGDIYLSQYNVQAEPAPAPVAGTGIASAGVAIFALAFYRLRRKPGLRPTA